MAGASDRKPFVLRLEPATMNALKAWAADDLRSLNGQIEYLLRRALRDASRLPTQARRDRADADGDADGDPDGSIPRRTPSGPLSRAAADREHASSTDLPLRQR